MTIVFARRTAGGMGFFLIFLMLFKLTAANLSAFYADSPQPGQLRINCGSTKLFMPEQYLAQNSGSTTGTAKAGLFVGTTVRNADHSNSFGYRIPVKADTVAPLYLSFYGKGPIKCTVGKQTLLSAATAYQDYAPFEFKLMDSSLWAEGYVDVKFESAAPTTGDGVSIAWVELGPSSEWRERVKHVEWDTSDIVWNVGSYDGFSNEFRGMTTDFTVGGDESKLAASGTLQIKWNQALKPGKKYYLLAGIVRGSSDFVLKVNGKDADYTSTCQKGREAIGAVDATNRIQASGNVAEITIGDGQLDFIALVEVTDGFVRDEDCRVVWKGNEMADDWTKVVNTTLFFSSHLYEDLSSGEFRTSPPHGMYEWYGVDSANQTCEMARWGYYDQAKQATYYIRDMYASDSGASAFVAATMAYLMRADNYQGDYTAQMYPFLKGYCDRYAADIEQDSRRLTHETNWEDGGPHHTTYDNSAIYPALLFGAEVAGKLGKMEDATRWQKAAAAQLNGINQNLILSSDAQWDGFRLPTGTWRYGLTDKYEDPKDAHAGMWTGGNHEESFFGYRGDSTELAAWRTAADSMLNYHPDVNWPNWKSYGDNCGIGTDYGGLSEGGGRALTTMLLSDRIDMVQKNSMHVIWNTCGRHFSNRNEPVNGFISPWALVSDLDHTDNGYATHVSPEQMNGVEYSECLKNARVMTGVDDMLYNGDNLVIIPRLPRCWNEEKVNQWPVVYRDGAAFEKGKVTFDFRNEFSGGSLEISASSKIAGAKCRMGPFEKTSVATSVTVNGVSAKFAVQDRGDSRWIWVSCDVDTSSTKIEVKMINPNVMLYGNGGDGGAKWSSAGGAWEMTKGIFIVTTAAAALNLYNSTNDKLVLSADIKVPSTSSSDSGSEAGLVARATSGGANGYRLVADYKNKRLQLRKDGDVLCSADIALKPNRTYALKLITSGTSLQGYLDGVRVLEANDSTYSSGKFGLYANGNGANGVVCFDNILALTGEAVTSSH